MADDPFEQIRQMLSSFLGDEIADQAVNQLRASGIDPQVLLSGDVSALMAQMSPGEKAFMEQQMQAMSQPTRDENDEPQAVNWKVVKDLAQATTHPHHEPVLTAARAQQITSALQVADLWLDVATDIPPAPGPRQAWTRKDWIEHTMPVWQVMCEPVAGAASRALGDAITSMIPNPEDLPDQMAGLGGMGKMMSQGLNQMSSMIMGAQMGSAVGHLALESISATDTGLPLNKEPGTALVSANVAEFADGLESDEQEVLMFLAVREAATARLYAHAPWLRAAVVRAVEEYAGQIHVDRESIDEAIRRVDPTDMEAMREAVSGHVFSVGTHSDAEARTQETVAWLLATVEGWVDEVTAQAVAPHLPHAVALGEMMRRHRASGSAAEKMFASLMGMNFRPAQARKAAELWHLLTTAQGVEGRDAYWAHPDVMPTAQEIASPETFLDLRRHATDHDSEIDAELQSLLDGTLGYEGEADAQD
ncbi:zinc-dependent metalloprotease [Actinomyces vulturis]|uniref:zinc-dependent metalloprotease n=1 Tax=Actinomyces vulturis TaxID=1857645 RepID=UPI000829E939|nr:zinc-dependent metalloprotease [Actinomyces vulturis]